VVARSSKDFVDPDEAARWGYKKSKNVAFKKSKRRKMQQVDGSANQGTCAAFMKGADVRQATT
jgi:hypothetical protein